MKARSARVVFRLSLNIIEVVEATILVCVSIGFMILDHQA